MNKNFEDCLYFHGWEVTINTPYSDGYPKDEKATISLSKPLTDKDMKGCIYKVVYDENLDDLETIQAELENLRNKMADNPNDRVGIIKELLFSASITIESDSHNASVYLATSRDGWQVGYFVDEVKDKLGELILFLTECIEYEKDENSHAESFKVFKRESKIVGRFTALQPFSGQEYDFFIHDIGSDNLSTAILSRACFYTEENFYDYSDYQQQDIHGVAEKWEVGMDENGTLYLLEPENVKYATKSSADIRIAIKFSEIEWKDGEDPTEEMTEKINGLRMTSLGRGMEQIGFVWGTADYNAEKKEFFLNPATEKCLRFKTWKDAEKWLLENTLDSHEVLANHLREKIQEVFPAPPRENYRRFRKEVMKDQQKRYGSLANIGEDCDT